MVLFHKQDLDPAIGRYALPNIWSEANIKSITKILDEFYDDIVPKGFYPHFNEAALRRAIFSAVPDLEAMQQHIMELIEVKYVALFIDRLHLQSFSQTLREKLLYTLSLSLGYPTPTDPRKGKLLWDVKQRSLPVGHFATFSEHNDSAELHTDTQYYPHPEEYFLLYVIRAARCGGGKSIVCSGREVKKLLQQTETGREALEILSTFEFPFRIPTTFTEVGKVETIETTLAPIFSDEPFIRFRYDTLEKGFQARPDLDVPEARQALKILQDVLQNKVKPLEYLMPDDSLILCNNHTALHGRTRYHDLERHLIRVRISRQSLDTRSIAVKLRINPAAARQALKILQDVLQNKVKPLEYLMPDNSLAICDDLTAARSHARSRPEASSNQSPH